MTKKKVAKAVTVEGGEEKNSKVATAPMDEDHQTVTNLKNLNDLLVKQTMELRQQVAGLNNMKEKLELDISQAEERTEAFVAERNFYIQKHNEPEEDHSLSRAVFDVERTLNASVIASEISQHNEESEKWQRRLESCLQEEQKKHKALLDTWKIEKEALEDAISKREAEITEIVRLQESIEKSRQTKKAEMENTISSQETKITKLIKLSEDMKESWETEKQELQRTISTLEAKTREEERLNEESKKKIEEHNLLIDELKEDVRKLNVEVIDLDEIRKDLENTKNKTWGELEQSEDDRRRVSSENEKLKTMILKLKAEMEQKEAQFTSLKEEMDAIENRKAQWKKRYEDANASGEKVLNMLRKTAEILASYEDGPLMVAAESIERCDDEDIKKYLEELEAICGSFRKRADKVHEMAQKIDKMMDELVEYEKMASMNAWQNICSSLTGAGVALALAFITKLRW